MMRFLHAIQPRWTASRPLPPDARRQWLEIHYAALRQGVLADASLP
ncbi:MAG: hypothetical protein KatS3mg059_1612 [Thermomicrobiales bacterium]|nr:MAG: hypothetical protein KatS3mg059_1612 [Thermomicrobiales bacterium]